MLGLLVLSRVSAIAAPDDPVVVGHCAAVHVLEAIYMGYEKLVCKSKGDPVIFSVIIANAVLFTAKALTTGGSQS